MIARPIDDSESTTIQKYLESGGTVLVVLHDPAISVSTQAWLGLDLTKLDADQPERASNPARDDYLMLAQIDFSHPVFAPLAAARYNDFTGIRFWKHEAVKFRSQADVQIVAEFDNKDPAVWQRSIGGGHVLGLASGWQPVIQSTGVVHEIRAFDGGRIALGSTRNCG